MHPGLKFPAKLKCPNFEKYGEKSCLYAYLTIYGVAMTQYGEWLLVQTFPMSLTKAAIAWFTKIEFTKIKQWTDLAHLFIEKYKFNFEIAPDGEVAVYEQEAKQKFQRSRVEVTSDRFWSSACSLRKETSPSS